ncbi:MAG: hypothetical protein ACI4B3_01540 [Prevotella sp.]
MKTIHMRLKNLLRILWLVALTTATASVAMAQKFKVTSVKTMKNDVSAFISPVHDLNGQACALIKVEAPADFVFSTPLGIVKRTDEVGEILLYVPNGTKMITIKHPEWGVLRNFRFEQPLESHICYVMKISHPQPVAEEVHDTVVITKTRVDTVMVKSQRPPLPRSWWVMATVSAASGSYPVGVMLATMRRHGVFIHASTDFRSTGDIRTEVNKDGIPSDGTSVMPYFTGKKSRSNYMLTAGFVHRLSSRLTLLEGAGYGKTATAWQLAEEEGGGYALNSDMTRKGVAAEMGLTWNTGGGTILLSVSTIEFCKWQVNIGFGIKFGKK